MIEQDMVDLATKVLAELGSDSGDARRLANMVKARFACGWQGGQVTVKYSEDEVPASTGG